MSVGGASAPPTGIIARGASFRVSWTLSGRRRWPAAGEVGRCGRNRAPTRLPVGRRPTRHPEGGGFRRFKRQSFAGGRHGAGVWMRSSRIDPNSWSAGQHTRVCQISARVMRGEAFEPQRSRSGPIQWPPITRADEWPPNRALVRTLITRADCWPKPCAADANWSLHGPVEVACSCRSFSARRFWPEPCVSRARRPPSRHPWPAPAPSTTRRRRTRRSP